jgi:S-(hydroxymethyl)glutathione dehydrogenase / alcohol dehydrogenase
MPTIRAAVCRAFGEPLTIEEVDLRAPQGREVEVTLEAVAICHSDISYADGIWGGPLPGGLRPRGGGTGDGARPRGAGRGDRARVVVTLIRACGHCAPCATGHPVACATPDTMAPPISGRTPARSGRR